MLSILLALVIVIVVAAVVVPLTLCYLLIRQVRSSRLLRRGTGSRQPAVAARRGGGAGSRPTGLRRQWSLLVADAHEARARYQCAVHDTQPGPLRTTLLEAARDVDAAVAEAERLAVSGDRTDRACRDVLSALDRQRRRRRSVRGVVAFEASLDAATRSQHASAERLAAASAQTLCQLQLVVARLSEVAAHAFELTSLSSTPQLTATGSLADRLFALREASAEIEGLAHV